MREKTIAEQKENIEEQQKQYTIGMNQKMECTATLEEKLSAAQQEVLDYSNLVAHEREEAARVAEAYRVISTSTFWKLTKPGRVFMDTMKKSFFRPLRKTLRYLRTYGLLATIGKIKQKCTGNATAIFAEVPKSSAISDAFAILNCLLHHYYTIGTENYYTI